MRIKAILMCQVILPTGSTLEQTKEVADQVSQLFSENGKGGGRIVHGDRRHRLFRTEPRTTRMVFVKLKDWELRQRPET